MDSGRIGGLLGATADVCLRLGAWQTERLAVDDGDYCQRFWAVGVAVALTGMNVLSLLARIDGCHVKRRLGWVVKDYSSNRRKPVFEDTKRAIHLAFGICSKGFVACRSVFELI